MALDLKDLDGGMPGITASRAKTMHEAAAVCLNHNSHTPGTEISIKGDISVKDSLSWIPPTTQTLKSWADLQEATEHGAYGVAALLVKELTPLTVIERARKGTGFDYWLGPKENSTPMFQEKSRLEVSGILVAEGNSVNQRVSTKISQVNSVPSSIKALVVVVDFGLPLSHVKYV
ncbi:MAG TPA: hypothetical protein VGO35_09550 [Gammaproteobacteria bacterium]|jgi:hypothetical protein|nr:hypothetical protein [Gammaproteobacteria bacterium]